MIQWNLSVTSIEKGVNIFITLPSHVYHYRVIFFSALGQET